MSNLLRADFARLFKSRIFWICTMFMLTIAVFSLYGRWSQIHRMPDFAYTSPDSILFSGTFYIGIVISVFVGIFVGTDYSNGTIRNKHVIGHSRVSMYFSNLIVCVTASLIMHLVWLAVIICMGIPLLGKFEMSARDITSGICISIFAVSAFAAIYLLTSMLITSKSTGSVTAIVISLVLLISAMILQSSLSEPEYYNPYSFIETDTDGNVLIYEEDSERVKNPYYPEETKRKVYEILYDVIPTGQIRQLNTDEYIDDTAQLSLYSLSIIIVTTAIGILIFRRKDLK